MSAAGEAFADAEAGLLGGPCGGEKGKFVFSREAAAHVTLRGPISPSGIGKGPDAGEANLFKSSLQES